MRHYPAGGTARPMAPVVRDLTCILCGTACTSEGTHVESWRDEGHLPLIAQADAAAALREGREE